MKAKDAALWSQQTLELRADETGQRFLTFFEFWFDAADKVIAERQDVIDWCDDNRQPQVVGPITPCAAMRSGLRLAEAEMGFLTVDWIGQMLAVAATHWAHGADMVAGMTVIEARVMEEALARKIEQLSNDAKNAATVDKE